VSRWRRDGGERLAIWRYPQAETVMSSEFPRSPFSLPSYPLAIFFLSPLILSNSPYPGSHISTPPSSVMPRRVTGLYLHLH